MKEKACGIRLSGVCDERHDIRLRQNARKRAVGRRMLARPLQWISTAQAPQSLVFRGTLAAACQSFAIAGMHCVECKLDGGGVCACCSGRVCAAQSARCCHNCSCSSSCVEMCGEERVAAVSFSAQANAAEAMRDALAVLSVAELLAACGDTAPRLPFPRGGASGMPRRACNGGKELRTSNPPQKNIRTHLCKITARDLRQPLIM